MKRNVDFVAVVGGLVGAIKELNGCVSADDDGSAGAHAAEASAAHGAVSSRASREENDVNGRVNDLQKHVDLRPPPGPRSLSEEQKEEVHKRLLAVVELRARGRHGGSEFDHAQAAPKEAVPDAARQAYVSDDRHGRS